MRSGGAGRQTGEQANRQAGRPANGQPDSRTAGQTGKPADLQIKALDNYAGQVGAFGSRIDIMLDEDIPKLIK